VTLTVSMIANSRAKKQLKANPYKIVLSIPAAPI